MTQLLFLRRQHLATGFCLLAMLLVVGCGYSEQEWRKKLNVIDALEKQLEESEKGYGQSKKELSEARARVEQLRNQLEAAGVDVANLRRNIDEQARALEEYKQRAAQLQAIRDRYEQLRVKLQGLSELGLKVTVRKNRMVIQLPGDVLFDSGRETLRKDGKTILRKVAAVIQRDTGLNSRDFQVAGHTDDQQYGGQFKDNWGLSVMRAREVLSFLVKPTKDGGGGLNSSRWSAAGYGDTDPVVPHSSEPGVRQSNRRCELVALPKIEEMLDLDKLVR
jgi:chemotaxis protein MotB